MKNDITELAQRITERKFHDWSQSVMHDCDFCNKWSLTVKHENGERICASCCDAEYTSKLEVANAALVEALEKAQAGEKQWREVVDAFCADDADWHKLTNSNNELIALLSQALCKQADRIAELESRTVKLPKRSVGEVMHMSGFSRDYAEGWCSGNDNAIHEMRAAGIKVEGE
ncbi:hypothetical protein [Klebsiella michiganensis]|uniref:hypothetical protein n=1 Tax=Klebsiella michiganensis TaxID=1134687 RepID=UPI0039C23CC7